jgi:hypothetical protein
MRAILIVLATLFLAAGAVFAQGGPGSITGNVTDSAGALMPGVRIEARNTETNATFQISSGSTGSYTLAQLPAGTYQISVSLPGFKQYTRTGISVLEAQVMRIDIVMAMISSDEILTNDSIIQLRKAGIDEDLILAKIRDSQHSFDLSVQGMLALKEGGVSDRLMHFMMDPTKAPEAKTAAAPSSLRVASETPAAPKEPPKIAEAPAAKPEPSLPKEIGVYLKTGSQWVEMQPEVVVWQSGGMLKRLATATIVQADVNGRIKGARSEKVVEPPAEFLIITPEGVTITEYQLIHLREQRDAREFRVVTGGILSSSGGAKRDAIPFEGTKILSRTFSVKLELLDPGEYGFLPTGSTAPNSSANVGKMYTFRVRD